MRVLAIGDVHGCLVALDTLLAAVAPTTDDTLVFLGDYVDRGPDSKGVLDRLIELRETHTVITLLGNHDEMMLQARTGETKLGKKWPTSYGSVTLESYGLVEHLDQIPAAHWTFLEECVDSFETETHIFVHANLDPGVDVNEQTDHELRWRKIDPGSSKRHRSGKTMICGHTAQKSGKPLNLGHAVCVDTGVFDTRGEWGGWLTCLDVDSGEVWMTSQSGALKTAHISDF